MQKIKSILVFGTLAVVLSLAACVGDSKETASRNAGSSKPSVTEPAKTNPGEIGPPSGEKQSGSKKNDKPKSTSTTKPKVNTSSKNSKPSKLSDEELVRMFPPVPLKESPQLEEALDLMMGKISYYIPDTIIEMEPFYPSVMISDSTALGQKLAEETARVSSVLGKKVEVKDVKVAEIKIGQKMRAQLKEPGNFGNFVIEPEGFTEQRLLSDKKHNNVLWQWTVVAKEAGSFALELNLEAVFYTDDEEVVHNIPVFAEKILVRSLPDYSWVWYGGGGVALLALLSFFFIKKGGAEAISQNGNIDKIEALIANGETLDALKLLQKQKGVSGTVENLLISHLAEYNDIRRQYNAGTIQREDMQMVVNRINGSLLQICDRLK